MFQCGGGDGVEVLLVFGSGGRGNGGSNYGDDCDVEDSDINDDVDEATDEDDDIIISWEILFVL